MRHSDCLLYYFHNSTHVGTLDPRDPDVVVAEVGRADQNNLLRLYLRCQKGKIIEAKFQAYASTVATACCEYACCWLEGKTIAESKKFTAEDLKESLELPTTQIHNAIL